MGTNDNKNEVDTIIIYRKMLLSKEEIIENRKNPPSHVGDLGEYWAIDEYFTKTPWASEGVPILYRVEIDKNDFDRILEEKGMVGEDEGQVEFTRDPSKIPIRYIDSFVNPDNDYDDLETLSEIEKIKEINIPFKSQEKERIEEKEGTGKDWFGKADRNIQKNAPKRHYYKSIKVRGHTRKHPKTKKPISVRPYQRKQKFRRYSEISRTRAQQLFDQQPQRAKKMIKRIE